MRNAVVAAVDERRLMVSQFYIESREHLLRASEEKYRNSINHAPDPMYEIEPGTWNVLGMNAAAIHMFRNEKEHDSIGKSLIEFVPPDLREITIKSLENVLRHGSDQTLDLPIGPYFVDVNSALISLRRQEVHPHDPPRRDPAARDAGVAVAHRTAGRGRHFRGGSCARGQ